MGSPDEPSVLADDRDIGSVIPLDALARPFTQPFRWHAPYDSVRFDVVSDDRSGPDDGSPPDFDVGQYYRVVSQPHAVPDTNRRGILTQFVKVNRRVGVDVVPTS